MPVLSSFRSSLRGCIKKLPKQIGIAIWGYGRHAKNNIMPAVLGLDEYRLVGVCTRNEKTRREIISEQKIKTWVDPKEMLEEPGVDVVYLTTPTGLHYSQGMSVLEANKHLICEKPLSYDGIKSVEMLEYAQNRGLVLLEAFMYLFHPKFLLLKKLIKEQVLGNIVSLTTNFSLPSLEHMGFRSSPELGGGAFLDLGSYVFSLMSSIFDGLPKINFFETRQDFGSEVDTAGEALLRFPQGQSAFLSWGYNRAYQNEAIVLGDKGSVYVDRIFLKESGNSDRFLKRDLFGKSELVDVEKANSFICMLQSFSKSLHDVRLQNKYFQDARARALLCNQFERSDWHKN